MVNLTPEEQKKEYLANALNDPRPVTVGGLNKVYRYIMSRISDSTSSGSAFYKIQGSVDTFNDLITSGKVPTNDFVLTSDTEYNPGKIYYKKVNDAYIRISGRSEFAAESCYEYVNEYYEGSLEGYIYNVIGEDRTGATGVNYVCIKQYRIYSDGYYQIKDYKSAQELGQDGFSRTVIYYLKNSDGTFSLITNPEESQFDPINWYEHVFAYYLKNSSETTVQPPTEETSSNYLNETEMKKKTKYYWETFWDSFGGSQPIATDTQLGVIKIGTNVDIDNSGKISVKTANNSVLGLVYQGNYVTINDGEISVNKATKNTFGAVEVGTNLDVEDGVISVKTSDNDNLGLVKIGTNIDINNGVISVATGSNNLGLAKSGIATSLNDGAVNVLYDSDTIGLGDGDNKPENSLFVKTATDNTLGIVKSGVATKINTGAVDTLYDNTTIKVNSDNKLYAETAAVDKLGVVKVGTNINVSSGVISVNTANGSTLGLVKSGTNVTISDGVISVNTANGSTLGLVKQGNNTEISDGQINVNSLTLGSSSNSNTLITVTNDESTPAVKITGKKNTNNTDPTSSSCALYVDGDIRSSNYISASKVFHAVWNDVSDAIEVQDDLEVIPGVCYVFDGKVYKKSESYCQKGIIGIHSDTAGDILGRKGKHKELDIAIGGFVLAFVDKDYESGTPLTCSINGYLTEMKREDVREYPERLIATYWKPETEELWGSEDCKVKVNGRHWVKIK